LSNSSSTGYNFNKHDGGGCAGFNGFLSRKTPSVHCMTKQHYSLDEGYMNNGELMTFLVI